MVACLLKLRPQATEDQLCLRKFLSLHGLRLLWSWMVDSPEPDSVNVLQFREQVSTSVVFAGQTQCQEQGRELVKFPSISHAKNFLVC